MWCDRNQIGAKGEDIAAQFLAGEKYYPILERNYRFGHGEVDIIALDDPVTVFVEVRTRQKGALVSGYFSVSKEKKKTLRPVCWHYIRAHQLTFYRFDIIDIEHDQGNWELHHYENVPFF
ncbi:MAG: YraN family protein [Verrucomicrobiota bacterium]|nr:MAG: YraN family protein [Verrucomicrobiota bacterium]